MKQVQKGFTLIELMIVVAIIGILAAIAIPQYQDYVTRARWQDMITQMAAIKTATSECIQRNAGDPTQCDEDLEIGTTVITPIGIAPNTATVVRGTFTAGNNGTGGEAVYTLTGSPGLGGCIITMRGTVGPNAVGWSYGTSGPNCNRSRTGYDAGT
jgi:type IV pilus assembly protein PilA